MWRYHERWNSRFEGTSKAQRRPRNGLPDKGIGSFHLSFFNKISFILLAKLEDEPYPRGELFVKTPITIPGYYNNEVWNLLIFQAATNENFEIGSYAFVNSLLLVDQGKHIRGFTGAKRDSDIRNFFDLLKILKKIEFDENREKE